MKFHISLLTCIFTLSCAFENIREYPGELKVSMFEKIKGEFSHEWKDGVHPFRGGAVIDVDGDGKDELFIGGGKDQKDSLITFKDNSLVDIIEGTNLSSNDATYGATSVDIDSNGEIDLIIARETGVYLYYNQKGKFRQVKLDIDQKDDEVPLSVAVSDIDKDGDIDLYISMFIQINSFKSATFNNDQHAKKNKLLLNEGNGNFKDITKSSGTQGIQNTFYSSFVDLNGDGLEDLVLSQNTGDIEIFKNNGDLTFELINFQSGFGFWMGLAKGDYDNDGDIDLFFTNIGNTIPDFLTKGDLREDQKYNGEWILLRNEGNFKFVDATSEAKLTEYGFSWGAVFEDINLDGHLDLLVAQNYVKWPIHKLSKLNGKSFIQLPKKNEFYHVSDLGIENENYGISPIIIDFNNDGIPDVFWLNVDGNSYGFLNKTKNNYFTIRLKDKIEHLGAAVTLETNQNRSIKKALLGSSGLLTDQSNDIVFALKDGEIPTKAFLSKLNGESIEYNNLSGSKIFYVK